MSPLSNKLLRMLAEPAVADWIWFPAGRELFPAMLAAIEAARAGQAGLPFNVVASGMQRLALQIEQASEHLGRTLGNMQEKVDDVVRVEDDYGR